MSFGVPGEIATYDRNVTSEAGYRDGDFYLDGHQAPPVMPEVLALAIAELEADAEADGDGDGDGDGE